MWNQSTKKNTKVKRTKLFNIITVTVRVRVSVSWRNENNEFWDKRVQKTVQKNHKLTISIPENVRNIKTTKGITNEGRISHFYIFNFSVVGSSKKHDFVRQLFVDNLININTLQWIDVNLLQIIKYEFSEQKLTRVAWVYIYKGQIALLSFKALLMQAVIKPCCTKWTTNKC